MPKGKAAEATADVQATAEAPAPVPVPVPVPVLKKARQVLGLGRRVILFGGGRQSEARGGGVRKLWVTDRPVTDAEAAAIATVEMPRANPLAKRAATKIQAAARMRAGRVAVKARKDAELKAAGLSKEEAEAEAEAVKEAQQQQRRKREELQQQQRLLYDSDEDHDTDGDSDY